MPAPEKIKERVRAYQADHATYEDKSYPEARARIEFIDPLLEALGWHPGTSDFTEEWRDCIVEQSLEVDEEEHKKRADYTCRIGQKPVVVVEAKKPYEQILTRPIHVRQVRRYAYSAGVPLGVLTSFAELAIYDGRVKPKKDDNERVAIIDKFTYSEYVDRWDDLALYISKEAIPTLRHREQFQARPARGLIPLDKAILAEIERWRDELAQTVARKNRHLDAEAINFAVGRTIDRILFLRVAEAKGIEPNNQLRSIADGQNIYAKLIELYHLADERYNSGLFHFKNERQRHEEPDVLTLGLEFEDKPLKQIIKGLYEPDNQYEFSYIPIEILGQVYEQFLGKVITLKPRHVVDVVDKPEVRKAGGVYYTPTYVVDYIVQNTVGKLLEGKTPKQIEKLCVLDPACGSGSFLLGAYQFLLNWYLQWYKKDGPRKHPKDIEIDLQEGFRLSLDRRKKILLAHIYGVDIDAQAVEVTKLSLFLKVLEGQTKDTVESELKLRLRALPDLGDNIKCGNSLISTDFYELFPEIDEEELRRVNPFDWKKEFPAILKENGFDAVIGNPPYVRQEILGSKFKKYAKARYKTFAGNADLYTYFIEKGVSLLRDGGLFSFIVSNKWLRTDYAIPLKAWLRHMCIEEIIDFCDLPVFQDATAYPCIIRVKNASPQDSFVAAEAATLAFVDLQEYVESVRYSQKLSTLTDEAWILGTDLEHALIDKMHRVGTEMNTVIESQVYRGVVTGCNDAFVIDDETRKSLVKAQKKAATIIKPFLLGRDVKRYAPVEHDCFVIFTRRGITIDDFPPVLRHLEKFKTSLMPKPEDWNGGEWQGRKGGDYQWYEIQDTTAYYEEFSKPKIIYPNICRRPEFTFDPNGLFTNQKCFLIPRDDKYLLGVLNSKLMAFLFRKRLPRLRGGFFEPSWTYLSRVPIRIINVTASKDRTLHHKMVKLVERMLKLQKDKQEAFWDINRFDRQIAATDEQIDQLVYELYDLTPEEIAIVEGNA